MGTRTGVAGGRAPLVLGGAVVAGWGALVVAQVSGHERLVHLDHQVSAHHGAWPLGPALVAFAAAWSLMVVAMMLPSALPMIGLHATAVAAHDRPTGARAAFLAGYVAVWTRPASWPWLGRRRCTAWSK